MPGGGPWNLNPGQITDDSELALCLMQGINLSHQKCQMLDMNYVAEFYGAWIKSPPFDIGMATKGALGPLGRNPKAEVAW